MTFFETNMEAMRHGIFPVREAVLNMLTRETPARTVETSRPGCPTLFVDAGGARIALHSSRDPVREADSWVKSYGLESAKTVLLFGVGFAYAAESVLRLFPSVETLLAVEPNLSHFATAMHSRDLSSFLGDPRVRLFLGPFACVSDPLRDTIDRLEDQIARDAVAVLVHSASLRSLPEAETEFRDLLEYMQGLRRSSRPAFSVLSDQNAAANADAMRTAVDVAGLFGKFSGVPVFLIAPGPSLAKNVSLLREAAKLGILVALDSALRPLLLNDCPPDFVVTVDPQPQVARYFQDIPDSRPHLVFFERSCPEAVNGFVRERRFLARPAQSPGVPGALFLSGSVLTAALDLSLRMGCDPVVLLGADHAVRPGRTHIDGSDAQRFSTVDRNHKCNGQFGVDVETPIAFYMYLRNMESYIEKVASGRRVWNATEGGADIAGTERVSLREALVRMAGIFRPNVAEILAAVRSTNA